VVSMVSFGDEYREAGDAAEDREVLDARRREHDDTVAERTAAAYEAEPEADDLRAAAARAPHVPADESEADDMRAASQRVPHEPVDDSRVDDMRAAAERAPHEPAVEAEADDMRAAAERVPHETGSGWHAV
jgi:hypothetical protein